MLTLATSVFFQSSAPRLYC